MKHSSTTLILVSAAASVAIAGLTAFGEAATSSVLPNLHSFSNSSGQLQTLSASGALDLNNPFFQSLGTNGRSCASCHLSNHSLPVPLNIGVSDVDGPLDLSYLPVFTVRNKTTHRTVKTTDLGRALITGKWKDIGKVKGPILRGLASRAPFFHNGSARTLADVIDFYNTRFNMHLTLQEKLDFVVFLQSL